MARRLIVEIVGDASSLQRALGSAAASSQGFGDRMQAVGARISSVGKTLTTHLTLPLVAVGAAGVKMAVDFQSSMELIHTQAGVSQKAVDDLSKSVLSMAGSVATTPETLSTGLYHLSSQGLRGAQALSALKAAAEGAKVGQANLEDVTNALGAVLVSHVGGFNTYREAMGELNAIVGAGDMRMQDLADAMGTGLPAKAAVAGASLRDVGAALAVFGDNNIRGAAAGTLLNSTLRIMSAPSKAAAKELASVGIGATQLAEDIRSGGLPMAIQDLKTHFQALGLTASEQNVVLTRAFGGRQAGGVAILIDQLERLKTKEREVGAGAQSFGSSWAAYTQTAAYKFDQLKASLAAGSITLGNQLLPIVLKAINAFEKIRAVFESLPSGVKRMIDIFVIAVAALGPVLTVFGNLSTALGFLAANPIVLLIAGIAALVGALVAAVLWPDKLREVLEKMGLSAQTAGQVVSGLQSVFQVLKTAGEDLVNVFRQNWSQIRTIISGAVDIIRTTIFVFVNVAKTLWDTFGSDIVAIARTYWTYIKDTIKNDLTVIRGVIELVTGLIHGDWSKVWQGLRDIVAGVFDQMVNILRTALSLLSTTARMIGTAIWQGIVQPIARLASELLQTIENGITSAVNTILGWVVGVAEGIGKAIADGIVNGIGNLAGGLGSALKSAVGSALHFVKSGFGIFSPSRVFANEVGKPLADGIIQGYLLGSTSLPSKISSSLSQALQAAKQTIDNARSTLQTSWQQLTQDANNAFQGIGNQIQTPAAKKLAAMQAQDAAIQMAQQIKQLKDAVTSASMTLSTDMNAGADMSTISADIQARAQAIQALNDQLAANARAKKEALLAKEAADEQKQLQARLALRQRHMDAALAALEAHLRKEGASQKQSQIAILKLLNSYGIDYKNSGLALGAAFAEGLRESIGGATKAAAELAASVARYLPHSPAEKGALSELPGWEWLLTGLPSVAAKASSIMAAMTGPVGAGRSAVGSAGSRGATISITVNGATGADHQKLAYTIRDELVRIARREPNALAGFA